MPGHFSWIPFNLPQMLCPLVLRSGPTQIVGAGFMPAREEEDNTPHSALKIFVVYNMDSRLML